MAVRLLWFLLLFVAPFCYQKANDYVLKTECAARYKSLSVIFNKRPLLNEKIFPL